MDSINIPSGSRDSSDHKNFLMNNVRQEAAIANARLLISRINEHCFEKCFPSPGTSISKKEETCLTQCMSKYIETWNTVGKQFARRAEQEVASRGIGGF